MPYKLLLLFLSPILALSQPASDIYLFNLSIKNGEPVVSGPVNITHRKGYDNQPFFHPRKPLIYYSSFNDSGRSDIKFYNFKTGQTKNLTLTNEREYSPTVTPDGKYISCIIQRDNGAQDLGKYPIEGGEPLVLINSLKVGYHVWIDKSNLLLFVLGDSGINSLHHYNLDTREDKIIAVNPGRSLHRIPGTNTFSFVHKMSKDEWVIKRYDPQSGQTSSITHTMAGREDISWLKNEIILGSDGNRLFYFDTRSNSGWKPLQMNSIDPAISGITRLACNLANTKLAVVANE
jgi:hypothetical protein